MITGDVDVIGDLDSSFGKLDIRHSRMCLRENGKKAVGDSVDHAFKEFYSRKAK